MSERRCQWCGKDIAWKHASAKSCSAACREQMKRSCRSLWSSKTHGPPPPKPCAFCGALFSAFDVKQRYCVPKGPCSQAAWRQSATGQAYLADPDVQQRMRVAARRHAETERGRAAQRERDSRSHNVARRAAYKRTPHGKAVIAENQRRRQAERALAMLLLPTQQPPEATP